MEERADSELINSEEVLMNSKQQTEVKIMEKLIDVLKKFLLDLLKFRESSIKFTIGEPTDKEKCQSACKNDPVSAPNFDPLLSLHIERQLITFDS